MIQISINQSYWTISLIIVECGISYIRQNISAIWNAGKVISTAKNVVFHGTLKMSSSLT